MQKYILNIDRQLVAVEIIELERKLYRQLAEKWLFPENTRCQTKKQASWTVGSKNQVK